MGIQAPPEVKFQLIYEALKEDDNLLSVSYLCELAGVSRSGYYAWLKAAPARLKREEADLADYELILEAYNFRGYKKGARSIHMRLLHTGVRMNVKKIRRLMKKFGLSCPIRSRNPYRQMAAAMKTSHVADNIVAREFTSKGPRRVLLTDITYLSYSESNCYLSTILDAKTHELLAYEASISLKVKFVIDTVDMMIEKHGSELDDKVLVHSDQGCHYTSNEFIEKLKDEGFIQSMSRKGNCWDNAPQESFFGHMKDDIRDLIRDCRSFEEVEAILDDWMDYYNKDRYQWELEKLSPNEYYQYQLTGVYPLPIYDQKKRK